MSTLTTLLTVAVAVCIFGSVTSRPQTPETRPDEVEVGVTGGKQEEAAEGDTSHFPPEKYGFQVGEIKVSTPNVVVVPKKKEKKPSGPQVSARVGGPELSFTGPAITFNKPAEVIPGPAITFNKPAEVIPDSS